MKYTQEDLNTDIEFLKGLGAHTEEVDETLKHIIKSVISMSREQQIKLLIEVLK